MAAVFFLESSVLTTVVGPWESSWCLPPQAPVASVSCSQELRALGHSCDRDIPPPGKILKAEHDRDPWEAETGRFP